LSTSREQAETILRACGGQLRMSEAIARGISRYRLYALQRQGVIEQISRGVYRLAVLPALGNPDLVTVGLRLPKAVVCLVSALAWHEMTTQIPHRVSVAIPRQSRQPHLDHPPLEVHRFSDAAYREGIEEHVIDGVRIKIYNPEKTLADCFKFRHKLGMDVVREALKLYRARKSFKPDALIRYAQICRVENVMRPYLEATL
jgi:predicted transcriptional regulator of viral defense system